ncbi:MAG: hypothetical protein ABNH30_05715 [Thalassolituus sp.]|jgi:hypothetical protein
MRTGAVVSKVLADRHLAIVIHRWRNLMMVWLGKLWPRMINRRLAGLLQA